MNITTLIIFYNMHSGMWDTLMDAFILTVDEVWKLGGFNKVSTPNCGQINGKPGWNKSDPLLHQLTAYTV